MFRRVIHYCMALLLVLLMSAGCVPVNRGVHPRTERLAHFIIGVSTTAELLSELGEPRGQGMTRFSADQPPRKVWWYEYSQSKDLLRGRVERSVLLVFLANDRYDGYLWFTVSNDLR
jgi:hypothetical protein